MGSKRIFSIDEETVDLIISALKEVAVLDLSNAALDKIVRIVDILNTIKNTSSNTPLEDLIYKAMVDAKNKDADLYFELYKLYRNLQENKLTENEALEKYNLYIKMTQFEKLHSGKYLSDNSLP